MNRVSELLISRADGALAAESCARNLHCGYAAGLKGSTAVDGSVLDRATHEYSWSSAWLADPANGCECVGPNFLRMVPRAHNGRCPEHAHLGPSREDLYPMSSAERRAAEAGYWCGLAARYSIPPRYRDLRLEELTATPAVQAMRDALETEDPRCITLAGPPGVGKTVALIAGFRDWACWMLEPEPDSAAWYSMPALARGLLSEEAKAIVNGCIKADLLAIDDVGLAYTKAGGWVEAAFEEILVEREAREAMTLLTTNLPLTTFEAHVGDRVADRLRGPWGEWHSLPGQSLRRKRRGTGA